MKLGAVLVLEVSGADSPPFPGGASLKHDVEGRIDGLTGKIPPPFPGGPH